jgi:hypothetical protein
VPLARFRLRSLLIVVAVVAVGLGVAVMIARIWTVVFLLQSESVAFLGPAYAIMALAIMTALFLIVIGFVLLAVRLRRVLRPSSFESGRTRPGP